MLPKTQNPKLKLFFPSVIAIPICQALLVNTLRTDLAHYTTAISPEVVIKAGPYDLKSLAHDNPVVLEALRKAYAIALQRIYILALSTGCAAVVFTFGMERRNVKNEGKARREVGDSGDEVRLREGEKEG